LPGCTINSGAIVPVTSTGEGGMPVGIVTDAVHCLRIALQLQLQPRYHRQATLVH
jgi:hypothetical protein